MKLDYIETHLVDHCNLNCKGCSHFSPLSGKSFADLDAFKRDFLRLRELFDNIAVIRLMGGEPLLHPQANAFLEFARSVFPDANIQLVTNGTLLLRQNTLFWEACSRNDILIQISRYPIKLDLERLRKKCSDASVRYNFTEAITHFHKFINLAGDSNPAVAFADCQSMYRCPHLWDGKVSVCRIPAFINLFNEAFGQNIPVSGVDFLNIHGNISADDVVRFLGRPIPLCGWCLTDWPSFTWGTSAGEIGEWTGTNPSRLTLIAKDWKSALTRTAGRTVHGMRRFLLRLKRRALGRPRGTITAQPNPIIGKSKYKNGVTTLRWSAVGTNVVEVRLGAADGPLFSSSGAGGSETTGPWVQDGMVFYLQNAANGESHGRANTLDMVRIDVCGLHYGAANTKDI